MMDRTALYARISEDPLGLERGVTRQLDDGRALIEARGWTPAGEFVDNDLSALSGKRRPQYEALMSAVDAGQVDRVVTYMQSRLWRNRRERADAIERLRQKRVSVVCIKGPELDLSTATGRMLAGLLGEFDTHESEVKGERVARAALARAEAGQANGAVLYGWRREYDSDDRGRVIGFRDQVDDLEAAVVREIVDRVLVGEGLRRLAVNLNERGIRAPQGGTWGHTTVRKIAMREANVGRRVHGGKVVGPAAWPALVDEAKHARVVSLLSDPERRTVPAAALARAGAASRRHLLTYGIGRCGVCGDVLRVATKRIKRRVARARSADNPDGIVTDAHEMYVCDRRGCVGRNKERVDELVQAVVVERLKRKDLIDLLRTGAHGPAPVDSEKVTLLRSRLDDAAEDYAAGMLDREQLLRITASLRPKLVDAKAALQVPHFDLPAELDELAAAPDVAACWGGLSLSRRRAVLQVFCSVSLMPTRKGAGFDPTSVDIRWLPASADDAVNVG